MNKFIDITDHLVSYLKQFNLKDIEIPESEQKEISNAIMELNAIIYTTRELTNINTLSIDMYLNDNLNIGIDQLIELENYLD